MITGMTNISLRLVLLFLATSTCLLFAYSLTLGTSETSIFDILSALAGNSDISDAVRVIVWEIRLPRALLALFIGATLGMSGAAMQGYLRNPLAEPGLLGVSSGAALGAVIALYSGLSAMMAMALPLAGLAGALVAVITVYGLAGSRASPLTLILAGVAVSAFAGALTSLALNLSPSQFATLEIIFWMMGSLADRSMDHALLAIPFMIVSMGLLATTTRALDALTLGEDVAVSLGINLARTQAVLVVAIALGVGAAVSVSGVIGFVGLVAPHLLRPFTRSQPGPLLFVSALAGGSLLLAADCAIRIITPGQELKLGVVTTLVGAPVFLLLVLRSRRSLVS